MTLQKYIFEWKINNFSSSFHKTGYKIDSPIFTIDCLKKSQWYLKIYPRGETERYKEFIAIYLEKKKNVCPEEFQIIYRLDMFGGDGKLLRRFDIGGCVFSDEKIRCYGQSDFLSIKSVSDKMEDWPEDVVTLRCSIHYKSEPSISECEAVTEIRVDRQSCVWNIVFSDLSSESLEKELFASKDCKFEIHLNMPGDAIKINICSVKEFSKPKSVCCKMALVDPKGKELISKSARHIFERNAENEIWEYPVFITEQFFEDNKKVVSGNGTICLLCKCAVSSGIITNKVLGNGTDSGAGSILQTRFKNMFLDGTYSDIKLKVEHETIQAHKCVLAVSSPVFAAMFEQDIIESKTNTVEIVDVEFNTFKPFLEFLYTEKLENLNYETGKKLLLCANKYQVVTLVEKCASFLESVLSLGNVFEILILADMIGYAPLKNAAENIIESSSKTFLHFPEWSLLMKNNAKLANQILTKIIRSK